MSSAIKQSINIDFRELEPAVLMAHIAQQLVEEPAHGMEESHNGSTNRENISYLELENMSLQKQEIIAYVSRPNEPDFWKKSRIEGAYKRDEESKRDKLQSKEKLKEKEHKN